MRYVLNVTQSSPSVAEKRHNRHGRGIDARQVSRPVGRRHDVWNRHRACAGSSSAPASNDASPAATEFLCLKKESLYGPYEGLAIACYSQSGCAFVEKLGAETLPDYDTTSVAAALGREKIEGIVTSSDADHEADQGVRLHLQKAD